MTRESLPHDLTATASLRGNEYAWPVGRFLQALEVASRHRLACLGGQFQFRTPTQTCELYWLDVSSQEQGANEAWPAFVARSIGEVRHAYRELLEVTDFQSEAARLSAEWPVEHGIAPTVEHLCFVGYFIHEQARATH